MAEFLATCDAVKASILVKNHVHTCAGKHTIHEDHFCPGCKRWWWDV